MVAGDLDGDSVTSWLKTLLADAFFWTDNDLVVQTRSMYGGAPRDASATFVLDQGGKVSHFNYFSNERTAEAIVSALVHEQPHGFRKIGPLSWAGEVASGARAALDRTGAADKPAVVLLGLKRPDGPGRRRDRDNIGLFYDDLVSFLSSTHEVIEFAFDWRRTMEDEGRRLADQVERALAARKQTGKPVRLLAHSVGGVVARTMQLVRPNAWKRLMARPGARLLMLGTPNDGFWAPMQVLSGDDTFGNALALTGPPFRDAAARQLMAAFPGFIQLQAGLLDQKLGLARHDTWRQLADADLTRVLAQSSWHNLEIQRDAYRWGVPTQEVLDRAVGLRKNLEAQRKSGVLGVKDQVLLVVGKARFTPDGYDVGNDGLVYLDAPAGGDGRVTLESAMLPGVPTWQLDAEHAALATKKDAFAAYLELLETGTTELLTPLRAAGTTRGVASVASPPVRSRPSRTASFPEPLESESDLYAVEGPRGPRPVRLPGHGTALRVTVINGDLTFVRQPLLLGHYRALRLTGTERVVDRLVGGAMSRSLKANLYPDAPGTHQVFVNTQVDPTNPWRLPRPEAVVVLGLGEEGKLRPTDLVKTVRQAVIAWAERMAEKPGDAHVPAFLELAATLIGSGGTGITAGQAAQLIAQGVREANERLSAGKWPAGQRPLSHRAVSRSRDRSVARAARSRRRQRPATTSWPTRCSPATERSRARWTPAIAAPTTTSSRRRRDEGPQQDASDRIHARHEAGAHRGARAGDAGSSGPRAGGERLERQEPGHAHRPHAVPVAGARGDGAVLQRHDRDGHRARRRDRRHPMGTARHEHGGGRRRAAVGDSRQAPAQAADGPTSARRWSMPARSPAFSSSASRSATRSATAACPARARRRARSRRFSPSLRPSRPAR